MVETTGIWLLQGFVLGGWKAIAVATGRSSIRTRFDRGLIILFVVWSIGWPLLIAGSNLGLVS